MGFNPNAIAMWACFGCIGWLINGTHGAVVGVAGALAISVLAALGSRR